MGIKIGLSNLHYALMTDNDLETYATPVAITGVSTANIVTNSSTEQFYGDDLLFEIATTIGAIELELVAADFTLSEQAILLGHSVVGGVIERKATNTAPFVAIGFKSLKSNGSYRYTWLMKGKFREPDLPHESKGEAVTFQPSTMLATFGVRKTDDLFIKQTDEDEDDYVDATGTNWFTTVLVSDTTAPTATVVPADAATGVAVSANIVVTFDEAIQKSDMTAANFMLMLDASPYTVVAATLSIDSDHDEVTINPDSNLSALTTYRLVISPNVRDLAGNQLNDGQPEVVKFTTA